MELLNLKEAIWKKRYTYLKVMGFQKYLPSGVTFEVVKFEPNSSVDPHYHLKTQEIYVVIEGSAVLSLDGVPQALDLNHIYFLPPRTTHALKTKEGITLAIFKPHAEKSDTHWGYCDE